MAIIDPWELDATGPLSNSNFNGANVAESCPPSGINNAIRQAGAWLAQATSYQSPALSASVSTNIAATGTGLFIPIVGANAINSLGLVAGLRANAAVLRFLQFSSSASLSNGTALRLIGGVSRRTQPGDIGGYLHVGSADVWHEFLWSPVDGSIAGGSISLSTVNAIVGTTVTFNATSASVSVLNVAGIQEFPNRITFMAHKNGTNQTSISASQTITFGTEDWDVGGYFSSNAYTPPSGKYRLTVQLNWSIAAGTGRAVLTLRKNGIAHRVQQDDLSSADNINEITQPLSCVVDANGTDSFGVSGQVLSGVGLVAGTATTSFFCGERI